MIFSEIDAKVLSNNPLNLKYIVETDTLLLGKFRSVVSNSPVISVYDSFWVSNILQKQSIYKINQ